MKKPLLWCFLFLAALVLRGGSAEELARTVTEKYGFPQSFEQCRVAPGLEWQYYRYDDFAGRPQSLTFLVVDSTSEQLVIGLDGERAKPLRTVTEYARRNDAAAAVNGGYFFIDEDGAHLGVLKIAGEHLERTGLGDGGWFCLNAGRFAGIIPAAGGDEAVYDGILEVSPLLVYEGADVAPEDPARHPRTAVGATEDGTLIFLVIDGRHAGLADGMTFKEMSQLFLELGCDAAMNFDGGGSSTVYLDCAPADGVVNYPSDNQVFDHAGSRRVASAVYIVAAPEPPLPK